MEAAATPTTPRRPRRSRGLHSRIVRLGTVILPLAALALLSTMFLLARRVDPDDAARFASVDLSERARDRQLTLPRFAGVSNEGTAYALSAQTARPDADDPRRMSADAVHLLLDSTGGGQTSIVAQAGRVDTAERSVRLDGDVRIETSTGYTLTTERLEGTLGHLDIFAPQEVRGTGPLGDLRAGSLRLDEDASGEAQMLFTGGVDLLYRPPT